MVSSVTKKTFLKGRGEVEEELARLRSTFRFPVYVNECYDEWYL
jgi:hypothetical protein